MRTAALAFLGGLLVATIADAALAQQTRTSPLRQPTSVDQTVFEYDNLYYGSPEALGESPADDAPAQSEQSPAAEVGDAACCQDPCCSCCGQCCCGCDPLWTVHADAVFLHRSTPDPAVLVTDSFVPGGNVLLDAAEFDFDYQTGWEISVARRFARNWNLEARYFAVDGWNATRAPVLSAAGSVVQYVTPIGNTVLPSTVSGTYNSELENVEINVRRSVSARLDVLLGFRYLELEDGGLSILQDIGPGANLATHAIDAANQLYGFQLGADAVVLSRGRLDVEGTIKAGVYGNDASNAVLITQAVGPPFASAAAADHTAFVGELGFAAAYRLLNSLSVRAGYQLLWIEGVALASDQVAVSDPANGIATVDTSGGPFYHGAFVGLQLTR